MDLGGKALLLVGVVGGLTLLVVLAWIAFRPRDDSPPAADPLPLTRDTERQAERADPRGMYERIGTDAIRVAVDQFYHRVLSDQRLVHHFAAVDLARLRRHQALFIGQILGGPVHFELHQLAVAHRRMRLSHEAYWLCVGHLISVLTGLGVPRDIVLYLLTQLYDVQELIITEDFVPIATASAGG